MCSSDLLDGRPHLPSNIRQWLGDARGHWEGDTLVVETTNFTNKTSDISRGLMRPTFRGTDENLKVTERFTRTDYGHMTMDITIDDPKAYAKPWRVKVPVHLLPDSDLIETFCENEKDTNHMK